MASSAQRPPSRCRELLGNTPIITTATIGVCVLAFVVSELSDSFYAFLGEYSISAAAVLSGQVYRVITAAFMHGGLLHIAMNMMSLFGLGTSLEPLHGSLGFAWLLSLYVLLVGGVYVLLALALAYTWDGSYFYSSAVGYSGVLFALAVDETALSPHPTRSVFGLFSVPTKLYPWVLMLLLQFLLPNVSLLGHLAGVLVGGAHSAGWLRWLTPPLPLLRRLEDAACFAPIRRMGAYKLVPQSDPVLSRAPAGGPGLLSSAAVWLSFVLRPVADCFRVGGGRGSTAARAGDAAPSPSSTGGRLVDASGRLLPSPAAGSAASAAAASPRAVAAGAAAGGGAAAARATAPALPASPAAVPGASDADAEAALGGGSAGAGGGGWKAAGAAFAAPGRAGYARVPADEAPPEPAVPDPATEATAPQDAPVPAVPPPPRSTSAAAAEAREKMRAAAEARMAAAASAGRPRPA